MADLYTWPGVLTSLLERRDLTVSEATWAMREVMAGMKAPIADSHLPKGDARVLAATKIIGGGQSTSVTFPTSKLTKGGDYSFFCSFPGHFGLMKGKLTFG